MTEIKFDVGPIEGVKIMIPRIQYLAAAALVVTLPTAAATQQNRSIALILDASGSMNAKLAGGGSRIDAAKAAVGAFVDKLDPDTRLSFRVYGHQSPTKDRNCQDTELMVGFDAAARARAAIADKTRDIKARGYTPITHVIQLAAGDLAKEPGARTVVLVSDGKETCEGDPCAAAKALADADAKLVIHTIGFNVDAAARYQLQCIAKVARGTYSDATGAADLGARLGAAAAAKAAPPPAAKPAPASKTTLTITRPKPGKLQIRNADPGAGHTVTEVETGKQFPNMSSFRSIIELPAGLYNVTFGPTVWKSVEVKAGETTVLDPGVLSMTAYGFFGHKVLDWETGAEIGTLDRFSGRLSVLPSTFTVTFGDAAWTNVEVKAGEHKILNPAVIVVNGADAGKGHDVLTDDGKLVGNVSSSIPSLPVPPGKYVIDVGVQKVPLDLVEGQKMEINLQ